MSIQIIDNFNLSVAKPIDDRFVVGSQSLYPNVSYNNKNDIPYKYAGLRVWDLDLGVPFVWSGTSWTSENSISISGSGSASYVPKFVGPPNSSTLGNSNIYISGNSVGINNTSITAGYILDIIGGVRSQGATGFSGVGTLLTNLNATNISTGTMSLARLANNNTSGWIITSSASQPVYTNPSTLTVGAASASVVFNETGNSNVHYVGFFSNSTGSLQSKVSKFSTSTNTLSRQLTYQPSTGILASAIIQAGTISVTGNISASTFGSINSSGNISAALAISATTYIQAGTKLLVGNGTAALPSISFISSTNMGLFKVDSTKLGISVDGVESLRVWRNSVYATEFWFSNANSSSLTVNGKFINWGSFLEVTGFTNGVKISTGILEVSSSIQWSGPTGLWTWFSGSQTGTYNTDVWTTTRARSITVSGDIHAQGLFVAGSDIRIKDKVEVAHSKESLDIIKNIEITKYHYKDKMTKGNGIHTKLIAQQVAEYLPEAVTKSSEFIPNIYQVFKITHKDGNNYGVDFNLEIEDLKELDTIKVVDKNNESFETSISKYLNNSIFFNLPNNYDVNDEIFIYGKKVDDFLSVDYDNVMCVGISATQELINIINSQDNQIKSLEDRISKLEG
jgi:hypothetical protein